MRRIRIKDLHFGRVITIAEDSVNLIPIEKRQIGLGILSHHNLWGWGRYTQEISEKLQCERIGS